MNNHTFANLGVRVTMITRTNKAGETEIRCWKFTLCDGQSDLTYAIATFDGGPVDGHKGRQLRAGETLTALAGPSNSPLAYEGAVWLIEERLEELREDGRLEDDEAESA